MKKMILKFEQLECPSCYKKIVDFLTKQSGITSLSALPTLGRIRMEYDETEIDRSLLERIISSLGYIVENQKHLEEGEVMVLKQRN